MESSSAQYLVNLRGVREGRLCAAPRGGDRAGGARAHEGLLAPAALEQGDDECSAEGVAGRGPVDGVDARRGRTRDLPAVLEEQRALRAERERDELAAGADHLVLVAVDDEQVG